MIIAASAEWSYSAEAFTKGGEKDEQNSRYYQYPSSE
jgi:hypothetical protein